MIQCLPRKPGWQPRNRYLRLDPTGLPEFRIAGSALNFGKCVNMKNVFVCQQV
jgi:hypothetical protein